MHISPIFLWNPYHPNHPIPNYKPGLRSSFYPQWVLLGNVKNHSPNKCKCVTVSDNNLFFKESLDMQHPHQGSFIRSHACKTYW